MKRIAAALVVLALAAPAVHAQQREGRGGGAEERGGGPQDRPMRRAYPNPSAVIAAELALTRMARDKGQWTAMRESAAPGAVMLVPGLPLARVWLKQQGAEPATPARWQPHAVSSSCDGSLMVVTGAWSAADGQGEYASVWERQPRGDYKWLVRTATTEANPPAEPEMLAARVADCALAIRGKPDGDKPAVPAAPDPVAREGRSRDGTLAWHVRVTREGEREFGFDMALDGRMQPANLGSRPRS